MLVRLFAPVGGVIKSYRINSEPAKMPGVAVEGRPASTAYIYLRSGETVDIDWSIQTGSDQPGPTDLAVTPSIEGSSSRSVASAC